MQTTKNSNVRVLTETAVLVALAYALSWFKIELPYGGSITPMSMLPIILIGLRNGTKWGLGGAIVYALLQITQGFYPPPTETPLNFALVVFLDYIIAFGVLGLSGLFRKDKNGVVIAVVVCLGLRFICHFISGIIIWGVYAPEGQTAVVYSFLYNGGYMGPELVICLVGAFLIRFNKQIFTQKIDSK